MILKRRRSTFGMWAARTRAAAPHGCRNIRTLAEEAAALPAVVEAVEKLKGNQLDGQLVNLLALKRDGLLESWILLNGGGDPGISRDYAAYRKAHHDQLRAYLDMYIIHPKH